MTNQAAVSAFMPHGLSENAVVYARAVVPGVVTATSGTFTITPGTGIDIGTTPLTATVIRAGASPQTYNPITITSFDPTSGTIVLTNGSTALAAGDVLYMVMSVNQ